MKKYKINSLIDELNKEYHRMDDFMEKSGDEDAVRRCSAEQQHVVYLSGLAQLYPEDDFNMKKWKEYLSAQRMEYDVADMFFLTISLDLEEARL